MNSRERIKKALNHQETDKIPVDFGGTFATGMNVNIVYKLRQKLELDKPGTPVKVIEPFQMLGEIGDDLRKIIGIDCIPLHGKENFFGFENNKWKEWKLFDGTPVLVPDLFNIIPEKDGSIFQYPQGDKSASPCAKMPKTGYCFELIMRQEKINDGCLDVSDNLEEFTLISDENLEYLKEKARNLYDNTKYSLFGNICFSAFGDVAIVPGPTLKHPKGIRDISEWYVSLITRKEYIRKIFEGQLEIALENYKRLYRAIGNKIEAIWISGQDFGFQSGLFISVDLYKDLFKQYLIKVNKWIHENTSWKTMIHTCGSVETLIREFIETGFNIINPVQISAFNMNPNHLKNKYGKNITFWGGGVDTQKTLPFGTPEDVKKEVKMNIKIFIKGGGFVFSAVHNIMPNVPIENVISMIETVSNYKI